MIDPHTQIVMLTVEQLAEEIAEAEANVCCATPWAAAKAFCGCGGVAADYLDRLNGEAYRRVHE